MLSLRKIVMMDKESMLVLIYVRVSSKEQVNGSSLAYQEVVCKEYAKRLGCKVDRVFIEEGESAKTTKRTKLNEMMRYVKKNRKKGICKIIVYKFDRFSRNVGDHHVLKAFFKNYGIDVISATEKTDNSSVGNFNENILAAVAQLDNEQRKERCTNGMIEAVKNGRWVWEAPVGYKNSRAGKGKSNLLIDPEKAPFIKRIFNLLDTGYNIEETRRIITQEGLTSNRGTPISKTYFHKLVKNPVYAGIIEKFGLSVKGSFKPIVEEKLFTRVQDKFNNKKIHKKNIEKMNPDFPLRSFIHCSSCGKKITGSWSRGRSKKYPYYRCSHCGAINIRKETLDSLFRKKLQEINFEKKYFNLLYKILSISLGQMVNQAEQTNKEIKKQISDLENKKRTVLDKNIKGVIDDIFAKKIIDECDEKINSLKKKIHNLSIDDFDLEVTIKECKRILSDLCSVWDRLDINGKFKLQWFVFPEGLVFDGKSFRTTRLAYCIQNKLDIKNKKIEVVEQGGIEPPTSYLRSTCSPN